MRAYVLGLLGAAVAIASAHSRAAAAGPAPRVLVELFTSEGCSSCPPADEAFAKLSKSNVVVLAHHVDYWNGLGWPDPFSSAGATARQRSYAGLGGGSYTPQVVIDGRIETVGGRTSVIERAIADAAKEPHASVDLEARGDDVTIRVGSLPRAADAELHLVIVQDHATVAVRRGENAGRTLDHVAIARSVRTFPAVPVTKTTVTAPAPIASPSSFTLVAFVQERASRHVLGATSIPWK
jgi:hypothetical protein